MNESPSPESGIFRDEIIVPPSAIDTNGHVNNVVFVQWMQDIAIRHFNSRVPLQILKSAGAIWVVRSHTIEYLSPAFAGERLLLATWIVDFGRVRSLRRYEFRRASDNKLIVTGATDWVLVNSASGRPSSIPDAVKNAFVLLPDKN
jgi:acyl-CoA thioester hydrolase